MENDYEFDAALARCLDELIDEERPSQACPEQEGAFAGLVELAACLRSAGRLEAPAAFRERAKARLLSRLDPAPAQPEQKRPGRFSVREAWKRLGNFRLDLPLPSLRAPAVVVLILLLLLALTISTTAAQALPGDPLYPLKTGYEHTRLSLARPDSAAARLHLEFVQRRYAEVIALFKANRTAQIPAAVRAYQAELSAALACLETCAIPTEEERQALQTDLLTFLAGHQAQFESILKQWPVLPQDLSPEEIQGIQADIADALQEISELLAETGGWWVIVPPVASPTPSPSASLSATATPTRTKKTPAPDEMNPSQFETEWATNWPTGWGELQTDEWTMDPSAEWTLMETPWTTYVPLPTGWPAEITPGSLPTGWPTAEPPDEPPPGWPTDDGSGFGWGIP